MAWIDEGCLTAGVIAHELGHNFGFWHSSSVPCVPASLADPGQCGGWDEYGDSGDTMGLAAAFRHFSSMWKAQTQWIGPTAVQTVTTSGQFTLTAVEQTSPGLKALRIPLGPGDADFNYWVEYRAPAGQFDLEDQVQIRVRTGDPASNLARFFYDGVGFSNSALRFHGVGLGGSVTGKITDAADGKPLPDCEVQLYEFSGSLLRWLKTGSDGTYRFSTLPAGIYRLRTINNSGYVDRAYLDAVDDPEWSSFVLKPGDERIADFQLTKGATISGRVVRESNGSPAASVSVQASDADWTFSMSTQTNSLGEYRLSGLPAGTYVVSTWSYDYVNEYYEDKYSRSEAEQVRVEAGAETNHVDFRLMSGGGSIEGRVVQEPGGEPIPGVTVLAGNDQGAKSAKTQSDGTYSIRNLLPGQYQVRATPSTNHVPETHDNKRYNGTADPVVVTAGQTTNVNFSLNPGATVSGRISDARDGSTLDGAVLALDETGRSQGSAATDATGRYVLSKLAPGRYRLWAWVSDFVDQLYPDASSQQTAPFVEVKQGEQLSGYDFALLPGGSITGIVTSQDSGKPIGYAGVWCLDDQLRGVESGLTDAGGRYLITGIRPGRYYLEVRANGYQRIFYPSASSTNGARLFVIESGQSLEDVDVRLPVGYQAPGDSRDQTIDSLGFRQRLLAQPGRGSHLQMGPSDHAPVTRSDLEMGPTAANTSVGADHVAAYESPSLRMHSFSDVTPYRDFHDPYRGVKIEMVDKGEGTGGPWAQLRVTRSALVTDPATIVQFGSAGLGQSITRTVTVRNQGPSNVTFGQLYLAGRNADQFSLVRDDCSGRSLEPGSSCTSDIRFSPTAFHSPVGEFAYLALPNDDLIRPSATVGLAGLASGVDLAVLGSSSVPILSQVGATPTVFFLVMNRGSLPTQAQVVLEVSLPPSLTYTRSFLPASWSCSSEAGKVRCTYTGMLVPGSADYLHFQVLVGAESPPGTSMSATVSSSEDQNPTNNTVEQKLMVDSPVRLNFPFFRQSSDSFTGFAFQNPRSWSSVLRIAVHSPDGSFLPMPRNPYQVELLPGAQMARLGHELFSSAPEDEQQGWVSVWAGTPLNSFFQFGQADALDGGLAAVNPSSKLVFTRALEIPGASSEIPAWTHLAIANPTSSSATVRLTLHPGDGGPAISVQERTLKAFGCLYESISQLFNRNTSTEYVVAETAPGQQIVGFELIRLGTRSLVGLAGRSGPAGTRLYSAQLANGPGIFTSLRLVNTTQAAKVVRVKGIDNTGAEVGQAAELLLPAGAAVEHDAGTLLHLDQSVLTVGSLEIICDALGVVGDVLFADRGLNYAASLPLQDVLFTSAVFGHVANTTGCLTGLAFFNPGTVTSTVGLQVFRNDGTLSGRATFDLAPGARVSKLLTELVPKTAGQAGGYVLMEASQPVAAQELFAGPDFLSAVPAIAVQ
ncbi:MAG: choice-of-anchor D domain-containing protein [Acidobacteria bacterium]|nr:MAG: choice-of-anchor D domain-containing protein [Acidobacteriota bacterium]